MKQGRTLQELAVEIERQHRAKVDYLAPTSEIELVPDYTGNRFVIKNEYGDMSFDITENAHRQLGEYVGIPAKYYDRLRGAPELLLQNVNHWLHPIGAAPDNRMVRTLDGNVRAFLSY